MSTSPQAIAAAPAFARRTSALGAYCAALGYFLFFSMLFLPSVYKPFKGTLLAICLFIVFMRFATRGKLDLHPTVVAWTLGLVIMSALFMMYGFVRGSPGALRVGTTYILWPLVYTALVSGLAQFKLLLGLVRVHVVAACAISLYALSYILSSAGWIPEFLYIELDLDQAIGFREGYVGFRLLSLKSLLFQGPFLVALLMTAPRELQRRLPTTWLWIAAGLVTIATAMSSRRALLLVLAMSPGITMVVRMFLPAAQRRQDFVRVRRFVAGGAIGLVLIVGFLGLVHDYDMQAYLDMFLAGFAFDDVYQVTGASIRRAQFEGLIAGWLDRPLIGWGHGSGCRYVASRGSEWPWAYEMAYLALLHNTGLLGFLGYASGILWIFWKSTRIMRQGTLLSAMMVPVMTGTCCYLIAAATNPYLGSFDYIWVVFFPVAFINYWLLRGRRELAPLS